MQNAINIRFVEKIELYLKGESTPKTKPSKNKINYYNERSIKVQSLKTVDGEIKPLIIYYIKKSNDTYRKEFLIFDTNKQAKEFYLNLTDVEGNDENRFIKTGFFLHPNNYSEFLKEK